MCIAHSVAHQLKPNAWVHRPVEDVRDQITIEGAAVQGQDLYVTYVTRIRDTLAATVSSSARTRWVIHGRTLANSVHRDKDVFEPH